MLRNFWAQERLEFHPLGSQLNSWLCFARMAATEDVAVKRRRTELETQLQQNTSLLFAWIPRNATHEHHQQLCGRHGALGNPRLKCMLSDNSPGDLAAMSACPSCFFVATWSQSSSPTCSKPGTHCTHHLEALHVRTYISTNVPTRLGWNEVVQEKGQDNEVFEMAWLFLCASSSRSDIAAMIRSPKILSQRIPASDHW